MRTLLNRADRDAMIARVRRLTPASQAQWGRLTVHTVMPHLADQLRVASGDIPASPGYSLVGRTIVKWLLFYTTFNAPRGKVQTSPEMLTTAPGTFEADRAALEALIIRMGTTPATTTHAFFGPLSHAGWARLAWKHLDHHLTQFGV
jgi:hypothetical protein